MSLLASRPLGLLMSPLTRRTVMSAASWIFIRAIKTRAGDACVAYCAREKKEKKNELRDGEWGREAEISGTRFKGSRDGIPKPRYHGCQTATPFHANFLQNNLAFACAFHTGPTKAGYCNKCGDICGQQGIWGREGR